MDKAFNITMQFMQEKVGRGNSSCGEPSWRERCSGGKYRIEGLEN